MDSQALAEQFWRDGYVLVDDFFDLQLMDQLDELIVEHFAANPDFWHTDEFLTEAQTQVIPWFPQQQEGRTEFDVLDQHAKLKQLTDAILGQGWRSDYCMVMFSKQGTSGQAWHQDCPPDDPGVHNLNRLVYTRDITDEIGGQTVVVPGTFRQGVIPAGDPNGEFEGSVVLKPKKGTLIMLHGHTWHRVLPIHGPYRSSTNYRAAPHDAPDKVTDICVYRNMRYQFSTESVVERR